MQVELARTAPPIAAAVAASGGKGLPLRGRRRRREMAQEAATPLAATFLGLLLVHNLLPAGAAGLGPAGTDTSAAAPGAGLDAADAGLRVTSPLLAHDLAAALPAAAITGDGLIDPSALTHLAQLSGIALPGGAAAATAAVATASLPGPPEAPLGWSSGLLGGTPMPELPQLAADTGSAGASDGDEHLGPIGRYVRGDGSDATVVLTSGDDIFIGSDGNEHVIGGAGDDYLDGAGGNDRLEGGTGDDTLLGGSGNDLLEGNAGNDLLDGGSGDDVLLGGSGNDSLLGGSGSDYLDGGSGFDLLAGGTGNEILVLADIRDAVTELNLGSDAGGNDTVVVRDSFGASLADTFSGTGGRATFVLGRPDVTHFPTDVASYRQQIDPDIENIRLEGSKAHDVVGDDHGSIIIGNDAANHIYAGGGDDGVLGGGGADWIDGGDGNDWLDGGAGGDTVYGGAGDDMFVFGLHEDGDLIFDHEGRNTLRIAGADPAQLHAGMQGDDLVLAYDGRVVATVGGYAGHADNYAGIDLGQGVRAISDFMDDPAAASAQSTTDIHATTGDWLAAYTAAPDAAAAPLPEPWSVLDDPSPAPATGEHPVPTVPGGGEPAGAPAWQPSMAALDGAHGAADLWAPMDALPGTAPDSHGLGDDPLPDHHRDARAASG